MIATIQYGATMKPLTQSLLLTVVGIFTLCVITVVAMGFITQKLGIAGVYWLVPIFGGLGGAVGGILRNSNSLELSSFDNISPAPSRTGDNKGVKPEHWNICLGLVGDLATGLGGATAAVFLFGGTLKFEEHDPKSYVLLVSVSFLAGAFGKQVVSMAGERLLKEAKMEAKEAKVEAESARRQADRATAMGYTLQAVQLDRKKEPKEALAMAELALESDPSYANAYGEKARALKRLGRVEEALSVVEEGLKKDPDKAALLYNRACYKALLGRFSNPDEVLAGLKRAFEINPELKTEALKDEDLARVRDLPEFNKLFETG